jgi:hypothetical protein
MLPGTKLLSSPYIDQGSGTASFSVAGRNTSPHTLSTDSCTLKNPALFIATTRNW